MEKYQICFYLKEDGVAPAEEFIRGLDAKMKAKILKVLDVLEISGPLVRMPYWKMLENDKSQKTPKSEIERAGKYREDYERRYLK